MAYIFGAYQRMTKGNLIHIRVGKEMKKQMKKLIDMGMFSTEAEISREAIRSLLIKYLKEIGLEKSVEEDNTNEKNAKKK